MESKENFSSVFWGRKDEIFEKIESFSGKSCILCNPEISENCNSSNENISDHFIKKHFNHAVEFEVKGRKGFSLPCRKQECLNRKSETEARRSHFHCPFCLHVFGRSRPLKHHLVTKNGECGSIKSSSDIQLPSTSTAICLTTITMQLPLHYLQAIDVDNAEVFMYDPLGRENTIAPTITTNLT
ncbi:unnamed protein product [Clavelina lepadiformis]|uniref:C2H2-type domain-containing protein n=1 Tax=Clavelina lepadiformis TaxID=159417 RepID=A0ABP0H384_CLALP